MSSFYGLSTYINYTERFILLYDILTQNYVPTSINLQKLLLHLSIMYP